MPTISQFYGIDIRMFTNDHSPPHIHARYGEFEACFGIADGEMIEGKFPPRARRLVREWIGLHIAELAANWERTRKLELPKEIGGLDADESN